jgi:adenylate cyclase
LGSFYLLNQDHEKAISEGKRAIRLNPNYAGGHAWLVMSMQFSGHFEEAITLMKKAFRLNPKLGPIHLRQLILSYIFLGRYDETLELIHKTREHASKGDLPSIFPPLDYCFVYQELGREEEARAHMEEVVKNNPIFSIEIVKSLNPYKNPAHLQRILDAYRKAGMPEKSRKPGL